MWRTGNKLISVDCIINKLILLLPEVFHFSFWVGIPDQPPMILGFWVSKNDIVYDNLQIKVHVESYRCMNSPVL